MDSNEQLMCVICAGVCLFVDVCVYFGTAL